MEVVLMGNDDLAVGGNLHIHFQGIDTEVNGVLHGGEGVLRTDSCTTAMGLDIDIVIHVEGIFPLRPRRVCNLDSYRLGILGRDGREIMDIQPGPLVL